MGGRTKSGRGLPHSKTLSRSSRAIMIPPGFGVRQSSAAFASDRVQCPTVFIAPSWKGKRGIVCGPEAHLSLNEARCVRKSFICDSKLLLLEIGVQRMHRKNRTGEHPA